MITALKNSFTGLVKPSQHTENQKLHGGWMFLLIFLLSIITAVLFVQPINKLKTDASLDEALTQIPEFTYSNGELVMEQQYMLPINGNGRSMLFYMDTDTYISSLTEDTLMQYAQAYNCSQVMAVVRDGMIVMEMGRSNAVPWTSVLGKDTTITNANLKEFVVKIISATCIICALVLFVFYIGIYYFSLLIYALIGLIINSCLKSNYNFVDLYKIVFSAALPLWLLKAILCMLLSGGMESLVKWIIRLGIILYFFLALYLKNKEEEQLAIQAAAAMNNNQDEMDINSFVSNHELDDDFR